MKRIVFAILIGMALMSIPYFFAPPAPDGWENMK